MRTRRIHSRWLATIVLTAVLVPAAAAQHWQEDGDKVVTLELSRDAARAAFRALDGDLRQRLRDRLATAREEYEARWQEFVAGKTTAAWILPWSRLLLEAEQATLDAGAGIRAALADHWERLRQVERVTRAKYQAGNVSVTEHHQAQFHLLGAEIALARSREGKVNLHGRAAPENAGQFNATEERERARARFETEQAPLRRLLLARVQVAREGVAARLHEFLAGKTTVDYLQEATLLLLEAERAARVTPEESLVETAWAVARENYRILGLKYEAGTISITQFAAGAYLYHDASLRLAELPRGRDLPRGAGRSSIFPAYERPAPREGLFERDLRHSAADRFEASSKSAAGLRRARLAAAREAFAARWKEYVAGKTTVEFVLEWPNRLFSAERAVLGNNADLERLLCEQWQRVWQVEAIAAGKYAAGSISVTQFLPARHARLDAEIAWMRAAHSEAVRSAPRWKYETHSSPWTAPLSVV